MSVQSVSSKASRLLTGRAIHLKIEPRTRNIRQSQEIYRFLKKFGEVDSFRNLRYDPTDPSPNTIIAIFRKAEAASEVIRSSPLSVTVQPPPPSLDVTTQAALHLPELIPRDYRNKSRQVASNADQNPIEFQIEAQLAVGDHLAPLKHRQDYWGYGVQKSFAQEALRQSVPDDAFTVLKVDAPQVPTRVMKKRLQQVEERKSLWKLYEEGIRNRKEQEGVEGPRQRKKGNES